MPIDFRQYKAARNASTSVPVTLDSNVAVGDFIIVGTYGEQGITPILSQLTDNLSNTWQLDSVAVQGANATSALYSCKVTNPGTITITYSNGSASPKRIKALVVRGLHATAWKGVAATFTGTSATHTIPSITPDTAYGLSVAAVSSWITANHWPVATNDYSCEMIEGDSTGATSLLALRYITSTAATSSALTWNTSTSVAICHVFYIAADAAAPSKTRVYLPSTGAAAISPTQHAMWERSSEMDRVAAVTSRISSAMATKTGTDAATPNLYDTLARQYVLPVGASAKRVAGLVRGVARAIESNAAFNGVTQIAIRIFNSSGVEVATINTGRASSQTAAPPTTTEMGTALTNRFIPPNNCDTLYMGDAPANGYIVIELGARGYNTVATSYTGGYSFGDNSATDAVFDQTGTAANNPWIDLYLFDPANGGTQLTSTVSTAGTGTAAAGGSMGRKGSPSSAGSGSAAGSGLRAAQGNPGSQGRGAAAASGGRSTRATAQSQGAGSSVLSGKVAASGSVASGGSASAQVSALRRLAGAVQSAGKATVDALGRLAGRAGAGSQGASSVSVSGQLSSGGQVRTGQPAAHGQGAVIVSGSVKAQGSTATAGKAELQAHGASKRAGMVAAQGTGAAASSGGARVGGAVVTAGKSAASALGRAILNALAAALGKGQVEVAGQSGAQTPVYVHESSAPYRGEYASAAPYIAQMTSTVAYTGIRSSTRVFGSGAHSSSAPYSE